MLNSIYLFVALMFPLCIQEPAELSHSETTAYCLISVAGDSKEVLIGMTPTKFLVFQDGDVDSKFSCYPRENGHLKGGINNPSIKFGNTILTIIDCRDIDNKTLVLDVQLNRNDASARQQCWVKLLPKSDKLNKALFDQKFTIQPSERQKTKPIQFDLGGEPTAIFATVGDFGGGDYKTSVLTEAGGRCNFPDEVRPTVTVKFPSSDSKKPITKEYELYGFC